MKSSSGCAPLLQYLFLLLSAAIIVVHVDAAKGMVSSSTNAPTPAAAAPEADCSSAIVSLAGCLTFVEEGSKEKKPQGDCCSSLKEVVKKEVSCLCQAFKQSADFGVKLNITKALALPSACGVKTPPFSKCDIAVGDGAPAAPAPAPALSPVEPPILSPSSQQSTVNAPAPSPSQAHSVAASFSAPSLASLLASGAVLSFYYL